jgi:hypothetical protein
MAETTGEPPTRRHEVQDVDIPDLVLFAGGLLIFILASVGISAAVFRYFVRHQPLGPPSSPLENVRTLPPRPPLQVSPAQDLNEYRLAKDATLNSYGWEDRKAGVVRISITRAMDLLLQRGLPVRTKPSAAQKEAARGLRRPEWKAGGPAGSSIENSGASQ